MLSRRLKDWVSYLARGIGLQLSFGLHIIAYSSVTVNEQTCLRADEIPLNNVSPVFPPCHSLHLFNILHYLLVLFLFLTPMKTFSTQINSTWVQDSCIKICRT